MSASTCVGSRLGGGDAKALEHLCHALAAHDRGAVALSRLARQVRHRHARVTDSPDGSPGTGAEKRRYALVKPPDEDERVRDKLCPDCARRPPPPDDPAT
jgi:hypothetical protein